MDKNEFQDKLRDQLAQWQEDLKELRSLAEKKKEEEDPLAPARGISAHEVAEALVNSVEEAKKEVDSLNDIAPDAWEMRGDEIRDRVEENFTDLRGRFEKLKESLKEQ